MNNEMLSGRLALLKDLKRVKNTHKQQEEVIIDEILDSRNEFIHSQAASYEAELLLIKDEDIRRIAVNFIGAGVKYLQDYKQVISNPENIIYERAIALFMIELEDVLRNLPKELFSTPTDYAFVRMDLLNSIQLLHSFNNSNVQIDKLKTSFEALRKVFPTKFFIDSIQQP